MPHHKMRTVGPTTSAQQTLPADSRVGTSRESQRAAKSAKSAPGRSRLAVGSVRSAPLLFLADEEQNRNDHNERDNHPDVESHYFNSIKCLVCTRPTEKLRVAPRPRHTTPLSITRRPSRSKQFPETRRQRFSHAGRGVSSQKPASGKLANPALELQIHQGRHDPVHRDITGFP